MPGGCLESIERVPSMKLSGLYTWHVMRWQAVTERLGLLTCDLAWLLREATCGHMHTFDTSPRREKGAPNIAHKWQSSLQN